MRIWVNERPAPFKYRSLARREPYSLHRALLVALQKWHHASSVTITKVTVKVACLRMPKHPPELFQSPHSLLR